MPRKPAVPGFTSAMRERAKRLFRKGHTHVQVAAELGIKPSVLSRVMVRYLHATAPARRLLAAEKNLARPRRAAAEPALEHRCRVCARPCAHPSPDGCEWCAPEPEETPT